MNGTVLPGVTLPGELPGRTELIGTEVDGTVVAGTVVVDVVVVVGVDRPPTPPPPPPPPPLDGGAVVTGELTDCTGGDELSNE